MPDQATPLDAPAIAEWLLTQIGVTHEVLAPDGRCVRVRVEPGSRYAASPDFLRLRPLIGQRVMTPHGPGRLVRVLEDGARVHLDAFVTGGETTVPAAEVRPAAPTPQTTERS